MLQDICKQAFEQKPACDSCVVARDCLQALGSMILARVQNLVDNAVEQMLEKARDGQFPGLTGILDALCARNDNDHRLPELRRNNFPYLVARKLDEVRRKWDYNRHSRLIDVSSW